MFKDSWTQLGVQGAFLASAELDEPLRRTSGLVHYIKASLLPGLGVYWILGFGAVGGFLALFQTLRSPSSSNFA